MPKSSRAAGRSFFSNLPLELRSSLRSQILVPHVAGANINDFKLKTNDNVSSAGFGLDDEERGRELLPTQPDSPGSTVDDTISIHGIINPSSHEEDEALDSSFMVITPMAESSTAGQKRAAQIKMSVSPSNGRKRKAAKTEGARARKANGNGVEKGNRKGKARTAVDVGKRYKGHAWDCTGVVSRYTDPSELPPDLVKYWYQRHFLLPQYDTLPLLLDDTGWFSITPQPIAEHIAQRCRSDVIIDAFCGVGGNTIEFAKTCERVIAIDNNPIRLRLARHNALHLGVADRVEFILGDFVSYAESLVRRGKGKEIDVVFLSPPWGGVDYLTFADPASSDPSTYPLSAILPIHGKDLFDLCSKLTPNIAYYLPRNTNIKELGELARPTIPTTDGSGGSKRAKEWVEVEEEWVGDKLKAVTAYYGGLIAEE